MWRLVLFLTIAVAAFVAGPVERSEAGLAGCALVARDVDIDVVFNYLWYAGAGCIGEDFDKGHIFVSLQYYDWNAEEWLELECCVGGAGETNDQDIFAWGAKYVQPPPPPYAGIVCRRIKATFFFNHSGRDQTFRLESNGECY